MGLIEPYKAKKYKQNGKLSQHLKAAYGKKLDFVCEVKDDKKTYTFTLTNKNDKIVFEAEIKEEDILQLAKSMEQSHLMFKED